MPDPCLPDRQELFCEPDGRPLPERAPPRRIPEEAALAPAAAADWFSLPSVSFTVGDMLLFEDLFSSVPMKDSNFYCTVVYQKAQ
jgi:hypothetical protein